MNLRDFPGGPVVKTLPSCASGEDSIPGWGVKILHALGSKTQNIKKKNRSSIVTNSIKTFFFFFLRNEPKNFKDVLIVETKV